MVLKDKWQKFHQTRFTFLWKAAIVGVIAGLVVSVFRLTIELLLKQVIQLYQFSHEQPLYLVLLLIINLVIMWFVGQLLKQEPNISGSGIPQVEGQLAGHFDLRAWPILWRKFIGGILSIGAGLFLGREGPSIQLGATIGQLTAESLKDKGTKRRVLIASGASAGLSAAFNAPIAGSLFVLEEIYHNFSPLVWLSALTSAVTANFVSVNFFGLTPVLKIPYAKSLPIKYYGHLLVLGIILGLLGYLYQITLLALPKWYKKLPIKKIYHSLLPLLLVIPVGYFYPSLLGGGNQVILRFNHGLPLLGIVLIFLVIRFMFSMVSYGSGLPGGIFLPILSLGALIGVTYGVIVIRMGLLPGAYLPNLIIFSMAGYFAGIGKAPYTAILLVTEMVGSLSHLMPLAIVALIAYIMVDFLGGHPIYESLLQRLVQTKEMPTDSFIDRLEIPIYAGSELEERMVAKIQWPVDSLLIEIIRGENHITPHGNTVIKAGDTLIVQVPHHLRAIMRQAICPTIE